MPRIDPLLLLKTLSVLLGPDGGIKESEDVQRVVNLMIRFSKKLVSKCIYIQILLATKKHLLDSFYNHGGWELVTGWFSDACDRDNWRLLEDMLHLFKDSPVTVERLKMNQSPKQVKHLSKDAKCDVVKELALEVVDIWMKVIKGESGGKDKKRKSVDSEEGDDNNWKMEIRNGICVLKKVDSESAGKKEETDTSPRSDSKESAEDAQEESNEGDVQGEAEAQGTSAEGTVGGAKDLDDHAQHMQDKESIQEEKDESAEAIHKSPHGKKGTDAKSKREVGKSIRGRKREHPSRSDTRSSKRKSEKGSEKGASSKDKGKSVSSPRHSSKDSSNRHRDHISKDRDSEKLREREKEKEQQRKKQSEKDKETLDMVRGKGISFGRLGAIPKKTAAGSGGKVGETSAAGAKSASAAGGVGVIPKKTGVGQGTKPEVRRPTVKTFGAKFRSTGLEDAVSTAALPKKKTADVVRSRPPPVPIPKRPQPDPPSVTTPPDKRLRIEQRPPVERPGGIKVIPPKPLHLQEASGFMDALNAISVETKRKGPKRVRRLSSKEDKKEEASAVTSPVAAKPQMKFYQDTQAEEEERDTEKEKDESGEQSEQQTEPTNVEQMAVDAEGHDMAADESHEADDERAPTPPTIPLEQPSDETQRASAPASASASDSAPASESVRPSGAARQLRGALIYHRPLNRRKLSVRWVPEDTLVHVYYFEMDETERVNVNRAKFLEMQTLEKTKEREFLRRARQSRDDGMSEQMPWQMLIVVDRPPDLVVPGVRSQERTHQDERELTSLPAFLNPVMLPDTPSEAEPEFHDQTPWKQIPLEDDQGDANVKDHTGDGWPEPRPEPCSRPPPNLFPTAAGPMPNMVPPSLMAPTNNWGPGGPMRPDGMGGMMDMNADMMPIDMMDVQMGMHGPGPGPGFGGPQTMMPPGGGWGPIGGPPMGPMMNGPGPGPAGGMMMGGPGLGPGLGIGLGPGPGPGPHFGGVGGGYRGRGWRSGAGGSRPPFRNYFDIPCRHYNAGHCRKGMTCQFMHSAQVRNGSSSRSDTQSSRGGGTGRGRTDSRHWNDRQATDDFV